LLSSFNRETETYGLFGWASTLRERYSDFRWSVGKI